MPMHRSWIERLQPWAKGRPADLIIGGREHPYMYRWYLTPWRRWAWAKWLPAAYLHCMVRSDDDRANHDHPWPSASRSLVGQCVEHTIAAGGVHHRRVIKAGQWRFRSAVFAHRLEIEPGTEYWTLFITGFRIRNWGFHCPEKGWVAFDEFASYVDGVTEVSKGCS